MEEIDQNQQQGRNLDAWKIDGNKTPRKLLSVDCPGKCNAAVRSDPSLVDGGYGKMFVSGKQYAGYVVAPDGCRELGIQSTIYGT